MSALKYLVVGLFIGTVCSYPHNQRHVRSLNLQVQQPGYSYPNQYPFQPYQSYQPGYGVPNFPIGSFQMGPSPPFPYQQSNPWGMPSYPSYGSGYQIYPSYPSYSSYPSYPSYPMQPNFQNQPDPYAHIPTEIIDVDVNGNFDFPESLQTSNIPGYPGFNWGNGDPNAQIWPTYNGTDVIVNTTDLQATNDTIRQSFTNTVVTNPFTATVTRTYSSESSDPIVDVRYSNTDSKLGSGTLIEATEGDTENTVKTSEPTKDQGDDEENTAKVEEENDKTTKYFSIW